MRVSLWLKKKLQQQQKEPYKTQWNQIPHPKEALRKKSFALDFGTWMWECKECQWIIINCKSDKRKAAVSIVLTVLADNKIRLRKKKKENIFLPTCVSVEYLWLEKVLESSVLSIWSHSNRCPKWFRKGVTHTIYWIFPGIFSLDLSKYCTKECSFIGLQTKTYI